VWLARHAPPLTWIPTPHASHALKCSFWGLELAYQRVPGVVRTSVGYTGACADALEAAATDLILHSSLITPCVQNIVNRSGGEQANPTYESVCSGSSGHTEAVQVTYDPKEVTYNA
jgi:peptide-methionine (S)-S-oxide reductase